MSARAALSPRTMASVDHELMIKTIKGLAMDGVEAAQSGHPGMPMGTAALASTLWMRFLVHDPSHPHWPNRDRFVLSAGHGSMLLYSLLHLTGYDLPMTELQRFRRLGSKTPGHPEVHDTPGVEVTTGPLGTGFAAAVGLAVAERYLAARYNRPGHEIIDHFTYGICSDGDLMEGIAAEAASFAGHQRLGKLVFLYDDNSITIDGSTGLAFTENVLRRFEGYGWQALACDGHNIAAVAEALTQARGELGRPTLIACKTTIAEGAPTKAGSEAAHGAPLGQKEVDATKHAMGWPLEPKFLVPGGLREKIAAVLRDASAQREAWERAFASYRSAHPQLASELESVLADELPDGIFDDLPTFAPGSDVPTRKATAKVLGKLYENHPTLIGGSADLAGSNGVDVQGVGALGPGTPSARHIHFGVREHGMGGIANGIALHGGLRVFDATFLIFSDFMRGAVRLSALMKLPVVHVFSHDSVFLGEDGPTHQPIEQCMSLRMIPNLWVVRPGDANETVGAWQLAMQRKHGDGPTAILVTRQGLPVLEGGRRDVSNGAYVLWEPDAVTPADLHGIIVATGSEVWLALDAAKQLHTRGKAVRVVSMPCWEAFEAQTPAYRESVLPAAVTRRLSLEAGTTLGWDRWTRHHYGIDTFGASGSIEELAPHFGFTPQAVAAHYLDLP